MWRAAAVMSTLLALVALSGGVAHRMVTKPDLARWEEIAWPFPRDGWPAGRAFRCDGGTCGGTELYVRAKRGFCDCDRGVADDDEVDRVVDIDLVSPRFAAFAPGDEVRIGEMHGRVRSYHLDMPDGSSHAAAGMAVSRRCDLLVAVVQGAGEAKEVRHAALQFLGTQEMKTWMVAALDGR